MLRQPRPARRHGGARLLRGEADLLLGLDPSTTTRQDRQQVLVPGSTVLLYSDGLVERRGADIDEGLAWLVETVSGLADLSLSDLYDELLAQVTTTAEDDVVLLGVRAHPEDRPRPAEAGPGHVREGFQDQQT